MQYLTLFLVIGVAVGFSCGSRLESPGGRKSCEFDKVWGSSGCVESPDVEYDFRRFRGGTSDTWASKLKETSLLSKWAD